MALDLSFNFTAQTVDGLTVTFTDQTTYTTPTRESLILILRTVHLDQDLTETRKELNSYDPTSVTTWTLPLEQSGISPVDGVHKITLFALTEDKYNGIVGGKYQINDGEGFVDEDSLSDAALTALSEDTQEAYIIPTPKLWKEETDVLLELSDHEVDLDLTGLNYQLNRLRAKRVGSWAQFQLENYSSAARILELV